MKLGLIGYPLGHSWSPEIHRLLIQEEYELYEITENELESFMKERSFDGVNVTVPYKQTVIKYLDELDEKAAVLGAVNTVVNRAGKLYGYNTDYTGFHDMILANSVSVNGKQAAVLGSGGAAQAVSAALKDLGADVSMVSRSADKPGTVSYEQMYENQASYSILVNATPVGLYPDMDKMPADICRFEHLETVIDVIANPLRTRLLCEAKKRKLKTLGGFEMLVRQAYAADLLFTGKEISPQRIDSCMQSILDQRRNIVIIGMPTAGKTTISGLLAEKSGREVVEMDEMIEEKLGMSIREYFKTQGEAGFRKVETQTARQISEGNGKIISCGGGVVTVEDTMRWLSYNAMVIWLKRDLSRLFASETRPLLSTDESIRRLYDERQPLYEMYADHMIDNNGTLDSAVHDILTLINGEEKS